jgi:hypothetical protein
MTLKIIFSGRVMCYTLLKGVGGMKKSFYLFMCTFTCCSLTQTFRHRRR